MIDTKKTLRGSGPAPAGYHRCYSPTCPARRSPFSGRFEATGAHYHPIIAPAKPVVVFVRGSSSHE